MYHFLLYILVAGVVSAQMSSPCLAQSSTAIIGARGRAMGNATACLGDEWSLMNNVAGMQAVTQARATISYDALPAMPAFAKAAMAFTVPGTVAYGLGVYRFGNGHYSEQIISAGIATRWNHTSLGLKVNYVRYAATALGARGAFTISFGGITELTSWLKVGARIDNINQPWLSKKFDERIPTVLTAGLLFTLTPQTILAAEVEKRINDVATGRCGLEFTVIRKVFARLGFEINPQTITGGFGFQLRYFHADYGTAYTAALGMRHQASVTVRLGRNERKSVNLKKPAP